ncbi:MAG TPA: penicillin-binding protein 1C [Gemmatimonadales bacterium]|nr:penicillin-binding protein 1C [Gemmatimonadales bacterium]
MIRWAVSMLIAVATVAVGAAGWTLLPLPPDLVGPQARPAVEITDRHGLPLRTARAADGSLARWVPLAEMDADVIAAFLATEDRRFYSHGGVDIRAVARAARTNLAAIRVVSGASTITMQLARLLRPLPRTWRGKARQVLWAIRLERHLSKGVILEEYLNRVPLGQSAVGVDAAARVYFGKQASALSLGEAALLAGLARAPSSDNPLVSAGRARARRSAALTRLGAQGYAGRDEIRRAMLEPVLVTEGRTDFVAPHFTTRLLARPGAPTSGEWRTSLDLPLQLAVEAEVRHTVETLRERGARHAAVVVLDTRSGEILAWVGSPDFWADTAGQVDMVTSARQPGSALKPFLYGLAFDRGQTPGSVWPDLPRVYRTATGVYAPRNYDRRFHGPTRLREALASSYNLPAVELANRLGPASLHGTLRRAGFASLNRSAEYYGLGLALGNGDVTLLELANAYRSLANGGMWYPVRWFATPPGYGTSAGRRVMSDLAAALVLDVLADPAARVPGFGLDTPLELPFTAAAKTGTSRHFTDNWAVVVTQGFTVATWVGDFSGRPMEGVSGVTGAAPLMHRAALLTARRYPPGAFASPAAAGAAPIRICRLSGLVATTRCPAIVEWVRPGSAPAAPCDWHGVNGIRLPPEYAEWAMGRVDAESPAGMARPAVAVRRAARIEPPAAARDTTALRIVSPLEGDRYRIPPGVPARYATLPLRAAATEPVRWFVDGRAVSGGRWQLAPGRHVVRAETRAGEREEVRFEVVP